MKSIWVGLVLGFFVLILSFSALADEGPKKKRLKVNLPTIREQAILTAAPNVPPPITRRKPAIVEVRLNSSVKRMEIKAGVTYDYWTFNDQMPGPFIRVRVGDILEVHHTNSDPTGMPHNIDFHAVTGPGGGAPVTTVVKGEERIAWFKMLHPGLYVYHCAAPPVMDHVANGMYGLILVEPEKGLPKADREFYVMQHEVYGQFPNAAPPAPPVLGHNHAAHAEEAADDFWEEETASDVPEERGHLLYSSADGFAEHPKYVFFNGRHTRHAGDEMLKGSVGEKVRIFFGNAGPNLISSFHVIGEIFDNVYREGDLVSDPAHSIQTTLVPAGGAAVVDFKLDVPGDYTLVDHAIFRVGKGAVGFLKVDGKPDYSIYVSDEEAKLCPGCLVHP